jgi:hypothetical protein
MNWFKIKTHEGQRTYTLVGSSPHTLEALLDQATQGKYVRLDDLVFMDRGRVKDWSAWDKRAIPSIVINPKVIIAIMQLRADPRTIESPPAFESSRFSLRGLGTGFLVLAIYILAVGAADGRGFTNAAIGYAGAVFVLAAVGGDLLFGRRRR